MTNKLEDIFLQQTNFMDILHKAGKLPQFPVDVNSKEGQESIRQILYHALEELFECGHLLKNRYHKTKVYDLDLNSFKEEMSDVLHLFIEICIMTGIDANELYTQFSIKTKKIINRQENGY